MNKCENLCEEMKYILDRNASDEWYLKHVLVYALAMERELAKIRGGTK